MASPRPINNPIEILRTLDRHLDHPVQLVIFGRSAIALGYPNPPEGAEQTEDIDGIIPTAQLASVEKDENFWESVSKVNEELKSSGLFMTHLFQEDQIVLSPEWETRLVKINTEFEKVEIYRPSTLDLILTKCMRGKDPEDLADIRFLLSVEPIPVEELRSAFATARMPIPEIAQAVHSVAPEVIKMAGEIADARTNRATP